ncbi:hypothetical protein P5G50_04840 [Leifsonia sp. F6_8S_P_1B]|uniref:Uncharacterized protein n=1 Tax=Leifsonia williamsii TaxID=3035919 RepID=A0ABT8K8Q7_9MICO|nr:hypothetical protein [Leifsonia williamsii]MDN4613774.1 hypothetical protein [Leifsonia williamsii]
MIADDEQQDVSRAGGFDPRYDPAFQRGYTPRPGEVARTRTRAPGSRSTAAARPRRWDGDDDRARYDDRDGFFDGGNDEQPAVAEAAPAGAPVVFAAPAPGLLDRLDISPRRNRWMLALWLVGAGFVVLGIVFYCISVSISYAGPAPGGDVGSLVIAQLGWMLAAPLVTVGLLTLVALLFLTALVGWRSAAAGEGEGDGEEPEGL